MSELKLRFANAEKISLANAERIEREFKRRAFSNAFAKAKKEKEVKAKQCGL